MKSQDYSVPGAVSSPQSAMKQKAGIIPGGKKMKAIIIASLLGASIGSAASAASLEVGQSGAERQTAGFAGARLRLPFGGNERPQAGLAVTSTLRSGPGSELRFAKGMELGFSGDRAVRLMIGGTPASRLAQGPQTPDGRKLGVSTLGWVAIGVGVLAAAFFVTVQLCADGEICGSE